MILNVQCDMKPMITSSVFLIYEQYQAEAEREPYYKGIFKYADFTQWKEMTDSRAISSDQDPHYKVGGVHIQDFLCTSTSLFFLGG